MRETSAFTRWAPGLEAPVDIPREDDEDWVGWYRNPPPWEDVVLLFSTRAIYVSEPSGVLRIPVHQVSGYDRLRKGDEVTGVRVVTSEGIRFVRIAGRYGPGDRYQDVFSLVRILKVLANRARLPQAK